MEIEITLIKNEGVNHSNFHIKGSIYDDQLITYDKVVGLMDLLYVSPGAWYRIEKIIRVGDPSIYEIKTYNVKRC